MESSFLRSGSTFWSRMEQSSVRTISLFSFPLLPQNKRPTEQKMTTFNPAEVAGAILCRCRGSCSALTGVFFNAKATHSDVKQNGFN